MIGEDIFARGEEEGPGLVKTAAAYGAAVGGTEGRLAGYLLGSTYGMFGAYAVQGTRLGKADRAITRTLPRVGAVAGNTIGSYLGAHEMAQAAGASEARAQRAGLGAAAGATLGMATGRSSKATRAGRKAGYSDTLRGYDKFQPTIGGIIGGAAGAYEGKDAANAAMATASGFSLSRQAAQEVSEQSKDLYRGAYNSGSARIASIHAAKDRARGKHPLFYMRKQHNKLQRVKYTYPASKNPFRHEY